MKYKYFLNTLLLVILSVYINAQDHSVHKKWELNGADERIEQNRKGDIVLEFILDDFVIVLVKIKGCHRGKLGHNPKPGS